MNDQVKQLWKLAHYSRVLGPAREITARMQLIGALVYDSTTRIDKVLSTNDWKSVYFNIDIILNILEKNPGFRLTSLSDDEQAMSKNAVRTETRNNQVCHLLGQVFGRYVAPSSGPI